VRNAVWIAINLVTRRTQLIGGLVLAVVALGVWRFSLPQPAAHREEAPVSTAEPVTAPGPPIVKGGTNRALAAQARTPSDPAQPTNAPPTDPDSSSALNERTLAGTRWARGPFSVEFGKGGKLLIGGRDRAQWRVEGSRIRLYRDATGEEHWLDIVGNKLMWEGEEISRVP